MSHTERYHPVALSHEGIKFLGQVPTLCHMYHFFGCTDATRIMHASDSNSCLISDAAERSAPRRYCVTHRILGDR